MQHRIEARLPARAWALTAAACAGCFSASWACSTQHPIGDLSERSLLGEPTAASDAPAPGTDFRLDPLLAPPDVTLALRGEAWSPIVGLGDVDADGFDDFAMVALDEANGISFVQLHYGGPRPNGPAEAFAYGESGARLAFDKRSMVSIAALGDVDGDGHADLLALTERCAPSMPGEGAYLLYGAAERFAGAEPIAAVATFLPAPPAAQGQGGCSSYSVMAGRSLGDVDGDGFDDVLLGDMQPGLNADGSSSNVAYLFHGRPERFESGTSWLEADASITLPAATSAFYLGDVTGDGRADLAFGGNFAGYWWVPGSAERLQGNVDGAALPVLSDCSTMPCSYAPLVSPAGDIDGDGVQDVLSYDANYMPHLFYGGPGLFEGNISFEQAGAVLILATTSPISTGLPVQPAGDRDGDGDGDLFSLFAPGEGSYRGDVVFTSGSADRSNAMIEIPIGSARERRPGGLFVEDPERSLIQAFTIGDIDGDGSGEIVTTSVRLVSEDGTVLERDPVYWHIHYGTPGGISGAGPR